MPNYSASRPDNYYYGGGGDTYATPLAVLLLLLAGALILLLPRKYAFVPVLLAGLLIPLNVAVVVGGLHFNSTRLLLLIALFRLQFRRERYPRRMSPIDKAVVYGAIVNSVAYVLAWREVGAAINRLGFLFSALGSYVVLRSWIRTKQDVLRSIQVLAICMALVAPAMWYEHRTQHNLFSVVGAEAETAVSERGVRARGPFENFSTGGTLAVASIPLFVGLWWCRRARLLAATGVVSSLTMMIACASSTPVMTLPAGMLALALWGWRNRMRTVRRWGLVALGALQVKMAITSSAPVWFAIDRVSGLVGGSGYHRAMLVDNFVRHFSEWCLIGTKNYPNWGWDMWDVDNAFVNAGLMGGLAGFILFVSIFVYGFRAVGAAHRNRGMSRSDARLAWAIGSSLFATAVGFFGIIYFDQSFIGFYTLLVMIQVLPTFCVIQQPPDPESGAVEGERSVGFVEAASIPA